MLQKARGEDSQSLLREIAYSCLVLPTETQAERDSDIYFLRQLSKVLKAQRAKQEGILSSGCKTGAKKVRIELLEYLRQIALKQGSRVQTANSISICSNSRVLKVKFPGVISFLKDLPISQIPKGNFFLVLLTTLLKLTNNPCAVSGRR